MEIRNENDVAKALGVDWSTVRYWQSLRVVPPFDALRGEGFLDWCAAVQRRNGRLTESEIRHFRLTTALVQMVPDLLETLDALMEAFPETRTWKRYPESTEARVAVNRLAALAGGLTKEKENGNGTHKGGK